jgi:c-di-AMP phosphodiesterase-like protein
MEKVGGGGHLNTAGAQVDDSPEEILEKLKEIAQQFL